MTLLPRQTWALFKKDLTILVRRRWFWTFIRALAFPVVFTFVLANIKNWSATGGYYGVGQPNPAPSLADALAQTGSTRPKIAIVTNGLNSGDIGQVISNLSSIISNSGKQLHLLDSSSDVELLCPSSNAGVTECYGAVEFLSSPDHGSGDNTHWNYTLYFDGAIGGSIDVRQNNNDIQLYPLAFQRAVDEAIATTHGGAPLGDSLQFPYTSINETAREQRNEEEYQSLVVGILAFAFFIGLADPTYYCVGYICRQRETGILSLVDAMLPNHYRWEAIIARNLATHLAFSIVYMPGWIIMGIVIAVVEFSDSNPGYFVLLYILTGLAIISYCILASSLFRKAQLSAISSVIAAVAFAMVAQFAEADTVNATQAGVLATGILFPPASFVYFLVNAASVQSFRQPLDLNTAGITLYGEGTWNVANSTFLGFLVFQIFVFPCLGVVIEWFLHSKHSTARVVTMGSETKNAVVLDSFSKEFKSRIEKKKMVKAVNDLSLNISTGAITVLLGANGSGKSTTLNAIAGLETVTSGSITVDGTGGIGICPQKNINWEDLTVEEHVSLLESMKTSHSRTRSEHKQEVNRILDGCDLTVKRDARAKTLSGGQKRKLQLAMMLAGGSKVCCIDEASSGIDPLARRKIWEILLAERGNRTLLLTTHFLDEAEVLSDNVAILSQGALKAEGSVATLKNQLGGGYRVFFKDMEPDSLPQTPGVTVRSDYGQTVAELHDSATLASFITAVQGKGITGYRIRGPTVEQIFLGLAQEMYADTGLAHELRLADADADADARSADSNSGTAVPSVRGFDLDAGFGTSPWKQTALLFRKRITIFRHHYMTYICAMFLPLALAGLVTIFLKYSGEPFGIPCVDPNANLAESSPEYLTSDNIGFGSFLYGPSSLKPKMESLIPNTTVYGYSYPANWPEIPFNNTFTDFTSFLANSEEKPWFGGLFQQSNGTTVVAWSGGSPAALSSAVFLQGLADSVSSGKNITAAVQSFETAFTPSDSSTAIVAVLTALGYSIYPCLFALYPTKERLRGVRAMHYSNGILSSSLWTAYFLFDLVFIVVISTVTVGVWASQWHGYYFLGLMYLVFILFGLASTVFSYAVSLFVGSQIAAMAITMLFQVLASMLYFVGYVITSNDAPVTQVYQWLNYITYTVGLVSPSSNLLRALFMTLNDFSLICSGQNKSSNPGAIGIYGQPILYLTLQFVFLLLFLIFWESGRSLEIFGLKTSQQKQSKGDVEKSVSSTNPDAVEDASRLEASNTGLRLSHVSKTFGSLQAVDNVTFGILPSEKFALLGPNGAGKSTTISLIRGELRLSSTAGESSAIYIGGDELARAPLAAKNHLGVCPQHDACDSMTLREHLLFYARARGVPGGGRRNIEELIRRLGLTEHADKLAGKLSGGTQRKLSLAIALIANPKVLLLDEPSSGMDPAAKRALWRTLAAVSEGRVLLLTTHSMEEADALCERVGIMAGRMLALGDTPALRARFGRSLAVQLVHVDAPATPDAAMDPIRRWVSDRWPDAQLERRCYGGQLRFSVPTAPSTDADALMADLFRAIEADKADLAISDYDIGPATLDQVFLNVVGMHNVREENTEVRKRRGLAFWRR